MARLIIEERRVLTGSLHIPHSRLFTLHKCIWMAQDRGAWTHKVRRWCGEFYASYLCHSRLHFKRSKPLASGPMTSTLVRAAGHSWSLNLVSLTTRWDIVRVVPSSNSAEVVIHWLAKYIRCEMAASLNGFAPRLGIRKATLTFVAKFFWLLVRNRVSPTKADNQVTWDRAVMVAALVAGVKIDFAHMLLAEIHERAFRNSTTYPFSCLIFQLCRDSGVPIWHCDRLVHPTGALDIGLIRDEANVAAPRREPQVEVPPLGTDLADTVGQAQGDDFSAPDHTDNVPGSSSQAASMGPSSSRSEARSSDGYIATPHSPRMQKSSLSPEARVEREDGGYDGPEGPGTIIAGCLELRVLGDRPDPQNIYAAADIASLWSDIEAILAAPAVEPQIGPTTLADDTVVDRYRDEPDRNNRDGGSVPSRPTIYRDTTGTNRNGPERNGMG
ncbi:hypothetical protein H5410_028604 [Solanum commersonii]|uniref:Putative plant transposon protein domain-containing protein n=1 Tax=Solanum commersonii TaxID=4109 RepID=A0A9J5Z5A4_SOLCO|nr:hypothetical protein H5410_028604 [Solanum commersonii]